MLSRLCRTGLKRRSLTSAQCARYSCAIISNNDRAALDQRHRTTSYRNRLCVASAVDVPVRYRRFDSKNDPKDDGNSEEAEESQNVRAVYDVKSNPDNTSIATIQVPEELPFLPLVTIAKPPLYPRLFRIVEVCKWNEFY